MVVSKGVQRSVYSVDVRDKGRVLHVHSAETYTLCRPRVQPCIYRAHVHTLSPLAASGVRS